MRKILVSTCLLGQKITGSRVRYNGGDVPCSDPRFLRWHAEGRFVHICPEVVGGLSTPRPRPRARLIEDRVVAEDGTDVTGAYEKGAQAALTLAQKHGITLAILKQDSPSCGSSYLCYALQPSGADPVLPLFVFLNPLKGQSELCGQGALAHVQF